MTLINLLVCAAFTTGASEFVRNLYAWVCYYTGMHHIPREVVKRQMQKEFPGVSLEDVPLDWIVYKEGDLVEPDEEMLAGLQAVLEKDKTR